MHEVVIPPEIPQTVDVEFTTTDVVEVITPGPPGPPGAPGGANYVHNQSILADTWIVTHNLGRNPSITVVDSGDSVILPNIHYDNTNQVTLTFSAPTSGKVYVN